MDDHNPTVPLILDIQVMVVVGLTVAALVSIFRTRHDRAGSKFWWSALVVGLPVIGPFAWFLFGAPPLRRRTR